MPLVLSVDHPQPVVLRVRHGLYATIAARDGAGDWAEAPVLLAGVVPAPDQAARCMAAIDGLVADQRTIAVQASATARGPFGELAVVEVLLADGRTLGEQLVAQGLAVPDPALIAQHVRHDQLIAALSEARRLRLGVWGESRVDPAALGIDATTAAATAPPPTPPAWLAHGAWLALAAAVLLIAWREAHWRRRVAATTRPRLRRVGELFLGIAAGFGRPLPPVADDRRAP